MGKLLIVKDADFSNVAIDAVDIPTESTYTWEQGGWNGRSNETNIGGPNTDANRIRLKEESYLVWKEDSTHFVSCASGYLIAVFDISTGILVSDKTSFVQSASFKANANKKYVVTVKKNDNSNIIPAEGVLVKLNIK